jgi:Ca2+-binding EF-hand superfamily protein
MNTRTKWTVASALAAIAGLSIAGVAIANPGFGHHGGPFHMIVDDMLGSIDSNADGALSQDEINAAINARDAAFDANKDGKLSLEEFQALWADLTRPVAVRAFQFLDPNGDAVLERTEVDKRFGSLVSRLDRNNDGKLSPEDRPHDMRWRHGWKDGRADDAED